MDFMKDTIKVAMINGKEVEYHTAHDEMIKDDYINSFDYIGQGYIYSVDGLHQGYNKSDVLHFWIRNKNHFMFRM